MVLATLLGVPRRREVVGLRLARIRVADRSVLIPEGKGASSGSSVASPFFVALGTYLRDEHPAGAATTRVFALERSRRGQPLRRQRASTTPWPAPDAAAVDTGDRDG